MEFLILHLLFNCQQQQRTVLVKACRWGDVKGAGVFLDLGAQPDACDVVCSMRSCVSTQSACETGEDLYECTNT